MSPGFAFALKATALGAHVGLTAASGLVVADIASRLLPAYGAFMFGIVGGTVSLLTWRLLGRFFQRLDRAS
jgi:hypothetical protein